jgi:tRNA-2-methylthio-N6-dimethylallyladenosine synthase
MRRGHTIESYIQKIDNIKSSNRRIALSTDIIVGFPGETVEDFEDTLKLAEYCKFDSAYIFKYSPRPGTPAYSLLDDVLPQEKTARFLELERMQRKYQSEIFQKYIGRELEVLVEKHSNRNSLEKTEFSGHSTCHKVVNFAGSEDLLGKIVKVKIIEAKSNTLFGVSV